MTLNTVEIPHTAHVVKQPHRIKAIFVRIVSAKYSTAIHYLAVWNTFMTSQT